jgi:hypothetical protein
MNEDQRPLSFDDIAAEVLAWYMSRFPRHVEDVILDLEGDTEKIPELDESVGVEPALGGNQCSLPGTEISPCTSTFS